MSERNVVVISGGCGGVGSAIGRRLAEDGFDVVVLYHSTLPAEARKIIEAFAPGDHEAIRCDIRDESAVAALVARVLEKHQRIDVAVHAAVGPIVRKNILETDGEEFTAQFETGVFGGFNVLRQTAFAMKGPGSGAIVGILSEVVMSDSPHGRMAGYAVGKYALRGLLRELHQELKSLPITVNAVAPSFLDTRLNADMPAEVRKFIAERAPSGTLRSPDDVARAVAFLVSGDGGKINGKIFSFDEREMTDL